MALPLATDVPRAPPPPYTPHPAPGQTEPQVSVRGRDDRGGLKTCRRVRCDVSLVIGVVRHRRHRRPRSRRRRAQITKERARMSAPLNEPARRSRALPPVGPLTRGPRGGIEGTVRPRRDAAVNAARRRRTRADRPPRPPERTEGWASRIGRRRRRCRAQRAPRGVWCRSR